VCLIQVYLVKKTSLVYLNFNLNRYFKLVTKYDDKLVEAINELKNTMATVENKNELIRLIYNRYKELSGPLNKLKKANEILSKYISEPADLSKLR